MYRGVLYKLIVLSIVIGVALLLWFQAGAFALRAWHRIGPKTPLGAASRTAVLVETHHLTHSDLAQLGDKIERVVAYQTRPRLELVGVGHRLRHQDAEHITLEIGLLPQHAQRLLKHDTRMELKMSAPSVLLLIQELFYAPRGRQLREDLTLLRAKIAESWQRLWPPVERALARHLPPNIFQSIMSDEYVMGRLQSALAAQVRSQVDFERAGRALKDSPELHSLMHLMTDQMSYLDIGEEALAGSWRALGSELSQLKHTLRPKWGSIELIWDGARCSGRVLTMDSSLVSRALRVLMGKTESRICNHLSDSMRDVALTGAREGGRAVLTHAWGQVKANPNETFQLGKNFGERALKELNAKPVLEAFGSMVQADVGLRDHVKSEYGPRAWSHLQRALHQISQTDELRQEINHLSEHVLALSKRAVSALMLDEEGKGPNPILLAMIREQLDGQRRAIVWVTPGESEVTVNPGHLFTRSELDSDGAPR